MVSQQFSVKAAIAILSVLSSVNGHMMMRTPKPYGQSTLNNSPLDPSGSDYPCKVTGAGGARPASKGYDAEGASNVMAIGETQILSFTGSAVHGGGSCQISLSTDLQPTADSKWMVIKSIEGGCPASVAGNLPADPNGNGAASFEYTIPEGIAPGEYTIAWSWLNKIGNREFYMNCGPATITAPKKKRYAPAPKIRRQTSFPEMFVANIATVNQCTTPEGFDYVYPNAGDEVQSAAANAGSYTQLACGAGGNVPAASPTAAAPAGGSDDSPSAPAATQTANGGADSPRVVSTATGGQPTANPGVFASGAAASPASVATSAVVVPIPAASAPASPAPAPAAGTGSTGSSSNVAGTACSNEGAWACAADGRSFQRCASGLWSVSMAMNTGMSCTPGVSDNLNMTAGKTRRHEPHGRRAHHFFGRSNF